MIAFKRRVLILICCIFPCLIEAQSNLLDSLLLKLAQANHDTTRCDLLSKLLQNERDKTKIKKYNQEILNICEENLKKKDLSPSLKILYKGNFAGALSDIAQDYYSYGDVKRAIELNEKVLKIEEEIGNLSGIGQVLNSLGVIYLDMGDRTKGIEYMEKSLKIEEKMGRKIGVGNILGNIGLCYRNDKNFPKALDYLNKSLLVLTEIKAHDDVAYTLTSLAGTYNLMGDKKTALEYFEKSLKLSQETGDKSDEANTLIAIGNFYLGDKQNSKALNCYQKALKISLELNQIKKIRNTNSGLYRAYKRLNNYKQALECYEVYIKLRDSLDNESNRKASVKSQLKYEYEKQATADSVAHAKESEIKNAELAKQKAEISAKKNQQYALFGGLGLVMIFAGFMYNRFKVTQKQKSIIEEQKDVVEEQKKLVEEKQKEILDSIQYARRIQMAQIPSEKRVKGMLSKLKKS